LKGKRADAKTFGASCRMKLSRAAAREPFEPTTAKSCRCESGFFVRDPEGDAVCGLCGCRLAKVSTRVDGFDALARFMRESDYVRRLSQPKEWRTRPSRRPSAPSTAEVVA
jgi:hypothetical protein